MKRILSITALIQRIRVITYQCDELVSNNIERTKLGQIEQQCNEAEALVMRFRARLSEKRRQLEMDTYLFGPKRGQSMMFGGTHIETNKGDQNETQSLIGNGFNKNDFYNNEQDSLNNALKTMNNALNNAYESINSLDRQREMFHNIQRRTAEIMDQLGFSKQVIGWISRQENTNTIITFLGMFITLFIVIVFYYYWKA
jgi:carboxylesterase type B